MPVLSLLGVGEAAPTIEGYGPIDTATARGLRPVEPDDPAPHALLRPAENGPQGDCRF